jgi:hypothetical protein
MVSLDKKPTRVAISANSGGRLLASFEQMQAACGGDTGTPRRINPRRQGLTFGEFHADRDDPLSHRLCDELRALIRADMIGSSPFETEVRQGLDNIEGAEAAGDPDRQALPRELVHEAEQPELPAIVGAVLDEVVGPDVVGVFRP